MYNKELKLNDKILIGLMNEYGVKTTIGLEFIRIDGTLYFNDTYEERHFTIKELIRDYILKDLRENLNQSIDQYSLSNRDLQVFFRHFLATCKKMKIDLTDSKYQSFDVLFNEVFVKFKNDLYYDFTYNFEQLFNGQIVIETNDYKKGITYFDLNNQKLMNNKWLNNNNWYVIKKILMTISYCDNFEDNHITKMVREFISLHNFLKGKKTIKINGNKQNCYIFPVLDCLKLNNTNTLKHGYTKFKMNYLEEITNLMVV